MAEMSGPVHAESMGELRSLTCRPGWLAPAYPPTALAQALRHVSFTGRTTLLGLIWWTTLVKNVAWTRTRPQMNDSSAINGRPLLIEFTAVFQLNSTVAGLCSSLLLLFPCIDDKWSSSTTDISAQHQMFTAFVIAHPLETSDGVD
ncbi:hypothetical protein D9619_000167 [Psilocybe cf. subviscida]|uniref:Uncharacterized protein n=1 Tax=Psilocybe cf. subviscida TaxID=2480587 RepID=A0A8H5BGF7_9AGAR|nr:hypothetical protein D9619_000167 [Psilocybe cf. subviscida]